MDNTATRSILQRQGLGRTRHISLGFLWAQKSLADGVFESKPISTKNCPADLQTKAHSRNRMWYLMELMGMKVMSGSVSVNRVSNTTATNTGAAQILRALAVLLEGGVAAGQLLVTESAMEKPWPEFVMMSSFSPHCPQTRV